MVAQGEADQLARAALNEAALGYIEAEGVCVGRTDVRAGDVITMEGLGRRFSGMYYVTSATHSYFPRQGYRNALRGRRNATLTDLGALLAAPCSRATTRAARVRRQRRCGHQQQGPRRLGPRQGEMSWLSDDRTRASGRGSSRRWRASNAVCTCLPEVDDEVLLAFEHGAPEFAYVLGALWNGKDKPPETNANGTNDHRTLKSRSGHVIRLDDTDGDEQIEIVDKSGRNRIVIRTATQEITIDAEADIAVTVQKRGADARWRIGWRSPTAGNLSVKALRQHRCRGHRPLKLKGATVDIN